MTTLRTLADRATLLAMYPEKDRPSQALVNLWNVEIEAAFSHVQRSLDVRYYGVGMAVTARPGKPLFRRSVSRATKAYLRMHTRNVGNRYRYRQMYRAKLRMWRRIESAKPTLWTLARQ